VRSRGNKAAGAIWRWAYFSSGQLLVYDIVHNRWCANAQREHRSNNIMFVTFAFLQCFLALIFLQYFDAVGWVTGRTSVRPVKNLAPAVSKGFCPGDVWCPGLTWSDLWKIR